MNNGQQKDLIFLVPDANMEHAIRGLMERKEALTIRGEITFDIFKHPDRDPGVLRRSHEFLRNFRKDYCYSLVMFDREGCGQESKPAEELEADVESRLRDEGWRNCCAAVVLDPELEIWVFANSTHVVEVVAKGNRQLYHEMLERFDCLPNGKPRAPKQVMEELLRRNHIPRSSSLYLRLAQKVSLSGCQDRAFQRFREVLQRWFPRT